MRDSLLKLIKETVVFQFSLPNSDKGLSKTIFSTIDDNCYNGSSIESIIEVIYNSILEYSFNEFDLDTEEYQVMHTRALETKLRYNEEATESTKLKYGFYGEVLLYSVLYVMHDTKPLISRGYFYNPLENSETKGFDSYHLVETKDKIELWFGEVKFRQSYKSSINEVLEKINSAVSDKYLNKNILAMVNHKNNFDIRDSKIEKIIRAWEKNISINIIENIKKYEMELIYPIFICFDKCNDDYDEMIKEVVKYIEDNFEVNPYEISISYTIFFILLPVENAKKIKEEVINWISSKKELLQ